MNLSPQELGAVLAGLRLLQRTIEDHVLPHGIYQIATDDDTHELLDSAEIDALCQRINE